MPTASKTKTKSKRKSSAGAKGATRQRGGRAKQSPSTRQGPSIPHYAAALRWLDEHADYERMRLVRYNTQTFNLDRMRDLLKALGDPQQQVRFAHIAGTKGKGSTAAMLQSMLQGCGYTVGLFTSPHLIDLRERIQINQTMIAQHDFTNLLREVAEKTHHWSDEPSYFEILTACAIRHFADQAVDIAILECGLGGRLDSTNVVHPLVCGITRIGLDHTQVLGEDLDSIAREKGGILKKDIPAVTVEQAPEARTALKESAQTAGTALSVIGEEIDFSCRFEATRELGPHARVCLSPDGVPYEHLAVPLRGEHQAHNCALALAMLDALRRQGLEMAEERIIDGLSHTHLPGRMEMVWQEPRIVLDGAHNAESIQALIRALGAHIPYDSLVMVFGCAADKEVNAILRQLNLGADKVIFTRARSSPRAVEPQDLLHRFSDHSGKMAQSAPTLREAINLGVRAVGREDLICVTGSFHLVGEAKKQFADLAAKRGGTT